MTDLARFEGNIYLGELDGSGVFQGFYPKIHVSGITPGRTEGETFTIESKQRDTYGQNIFSEQTPGDTTLELAILEQPSWILAAAFSGVESAVNVVAGSVVDENLTATVLDRNYVLAQRNIKAAPAMVVTNVGATVTYTVDVDYEIVDLRIGMIRILSSGAIIAGQVLEVSYDYDAFTGYQILGEGDPEKSFRVLADLKNRITGKDLQVLWHDVKLSAPDVFDLLSSDVITITLSGIATTPAGESSPYKVLGQS